MTAEEAFYCTILYHAKNKTEGNELLHAICKCIVEDAERLKATDLSYENAINIINGKPTVKVEVPTSKKVNEETETEIEEKNVGTFNEALRTLPDELAI